MPNSRLQGIARTTIKTKGFSLIEVMVSLTLLAVSMMALMSMQTAALRASSENQQFLMAQQVAESAIEWVRTLSDNELDSAADVFPLLGKSAVTGLGSEYQFTGLPSSAMPADLTSFSPNYTRYVGYRVRTVQDPNKVHIDRLFVVRLMVEKNYRTILSRCAATVYWVQGGSLQSLDVVFFVDRKV